MTGEVTLRRPEGAPVLRELHGRVAADADRAFAALVRRIQPQAVDTAVRRAVVQGGYWYRGEYVVAAEGSGSTVHYTIVNVAPPPKLLGVLTGRGEVRAAPANFRSLLRSIGDDAAAQGSTDQGST